MSGRQLPESFVKKTQVASNLCLYRSSPSRQTSQHEQLVVRLENQCHRTYFPDDTDYAAAVVRDKFCICIAEAVTKSGGADKDLKEAVDYCSRQL